jgi:hypothetical protein
MAARFIRFQPGSAYSYRAGCGGHSYHNLAVESSIQIVLTVPEVNIISTQDNFCRKHILNNLLLTFIILY